MTSWKEKLESQIPEDWNEEIDVFFGDISCVTDDKCLQ